MEERRRNKTCIQADSLIPHLLGMFRPPTSSLPMAMAMKVVKSKAPTPSRSAYWWISCFHYDNSKKHSKIVKNAQKRSKDAMKCDNDEWILNNESQIRFFSITRLDEQPVQIIWHVFTSDEAVAELSRAFQSSLIHDQQLPFEAVHGVDPRAVASKFRQSMSQVLILGCRMSDVIGHRHLRHLLHLSTSSFLCYVSILLGEG